MPNGESKNWVRFIITLEAFYRLFGNWPSKIHLYPFFIEELQEKLSLKDFQILESKITLIPDEDNPFLALDDAANIFDYARGHVPRKKELSKGAIDWLGIDGPDYCD